MTPDNIVTPYVYEIVEIWEKITTANGIKSIKNQYYCTFCALVNKIKGEWHILTIKSMHWCEKYLQKPCHLVPKKIP